VQTDPETDSVTIDLPQNPLISIVKTFVDDAVIAGAFVGSAFTLEVTNDGNVTLSDALITDLVDSRLYVTAVDFTTPTAGGGENCSVGQNISCSIPTLAVGESAIITVEFMVASDVEEADGIDGLNDADAVTNTADVAAEAPLGDPSDPADDIKDEDSDNIDILVEINLSIVKTFLEQDDDGFCTEVSESSIEQGKEGCFTMVVSNDGPSDAVDVDVTDMVNSVLEIAELDGVNVTLGDGSCDDTDMDVQSIECTANIPVASSVTITAFYTAAPALPEPPEDTLFGTTSGDEFRFVFLHLDGSISILEGSTDTGLVFLDGVDISNEVDIIPGLTKNEITFDPAGDDPAFTMHLSCSDRFIGGWGEGDGPTAGIDENWQIASYSITRYNQNGFIKSCGDTPVEFDVPNIATATGTDSFGAESVSDEAVIEIVDPSLVFPENDAVDFKNRDVYFKFVSRNPEDMLITEIEIRWPELSSNGALRSIRFGKDTLWTGNEAGTVEVDKWGRKVIISDDGYTTDNAGVIIDADGIFSSQESARLLEALQKQKLRFSFANRPVDDPSFYHYSFIVTFADGTDVSVNSDGTME
jgi:hypothetical protein